MSASKKAAAYEDASAKALREAQALVEDIKHFRTHGTGDMCRNYRDYEAGDGYDWIVRRALAMAAQIETFDRGGRERRAASAREVAS